ncbi:unnamed protein product [Rotaria magnacalcarata]|uniref:Uncharacterized protein n=1 Tax=Rotaria magnacalcarata TaxID=392030 RepID=A0A815X109_9BILA|nr:unnamed protein product [Rotaria magnacalcarata]CAF1552691.1 unnamed protein product [Rotaria magnacalcarata]CAF3792196.1 unnamed protein product [Rotaria magnacalcarata]CAF3861535.1 unnamed protein product [Rotaria magnacalcarata]
MNHRQVASKEKKEEELNEEEECNILSNFWPNVNDAKSDNNALDEILEELHRIRDEAILDLTSAGFAKDFANVENLKNKIKRIQLYQDVTIGHMIKNLPPDQLNNGTERYRYRNRKRNIQIGVPCSLNAFYTYNNAQELIDSTSAEQFGHKTFPQLFNDTQNNTTIPHFEITDPLPNPSLRGARVNKAAADPAQRQQQPIKQQQGFVTTNTEQQQEQSTDSKDIEEQEASISTNTEQQQNQAVATVPANTGICSASMQNQEAPEAIKPVAERFRRLHAAQNPFHASQQQHLQHQTSQTLTSVNTNSVEQHHDNDNCDDADNSNNDSEGQE